MTGRREAPRLLAVLRLVAESFGDLRVPWALIGGLAVSVRAEPRFTRDIDLAVAVRFRKRNFKVAYQGGAFYIGNPEVA
jgi:hypothetical protein